MDTETRKNKVGRSAGPPVIRVNLMLDAEGVAWGKAQDGGLSAAVRRLIREERARQARKAKREGNNEQETEH